MKLELEDLKAIKNNIKNIYFDLDGTLLNNKKKIDFSTKNIIKKLLANNLNIGVATGRSHLSIKYVIEELELNLPIIAGNGAMYYYNKKWNLEKQIPINIVKIIINFLNDRNLGFSVYTSATIYDFNCYYNNNDKEYHDETTIEEFEKINKEPVYKFFVNLEDKIFSNEVAYKEITNKILNIGSLEIVSSEKNFIDIIPKNVSKGNTIKLVLEEQNLSTNETLVFGDNNNDISMFETIKYSIAMINGSEIAKEKAQFISLSSNDNQGVEQMLKLIFGL